MERGAQERKCVINSQRLLCTSEVTKRTNHFTSVILYSVVFKPFGLSYFWLSIGITHKHTCTHTQIPLYAMHCYLALYPSGFFNAGHNLLN